MKKKLTTVLAIVLVVALSVAGTYAYLTDTTGPIVNTFTVGNVSIDLTETPRDYKMVPGAELDKDPTVTVTADSEDSYVFVKVEKSNNFDRFMTYTMADGWTQLKDADGVEVPGVFYRVHSSVATDTIYHVLSGDSVKVRDDVTKDMMDAIEEGEAGNPTLTFTAYACQSAGFDTAAAAWAEISN